MKIKHNLSQSSLLLHSWLVELLSELQPVRMRTRVRIPGSALIGRGDNLVYVGNTPTP